MPNRSTDTPRCYLCAGPRDTTEAICSKCSKSIAEDPGDAPARAIESPGLL